MATPSVNHRKTVWVFASLGAKRGQTGHPEKTKFRKKKSNITKISIPLIKGGAGTGGKIKLGGDTGEQNGSPRNVGNFEVFKGGLLQRMGPKDLRTRHVVPCVCLDGVIWCWSERPQKLYFSTGGWSLHLQPQPLVKTNLARPPQSNLSQKLEKDDKGFSPNSMAIQLNRRLKPASQAENGCT